MAGARLGEPRDVLTLAEVPDPEPGPGQVLVRVLGAAANFPDVLMCRGDYQVRRRCPTRRAWNSAARCGAGPGRDRVRAGRPAHRRPGRRRLRRAGADERGRALPAPDRLDDAEAAAFFITYQTGWFGLHRRAGLPAGETLLVQAAAGGVGSAAVQLGKAAGARVIGVVGGAEKAEVARALGADVVIDRHTQDFVEVVKEVTGGRGADVVYDPVGGDAYTRSTKCIAFEGRILVIGFAGGQIQSAALNHALVKNYSIVGLHWGLYQSKIPSSSGLPRAAHQARRRRRHPAAGQRAARAGGGAGRAAATRRRRHGRPDRLRPLTREIRGIRGRLLRSTARCRCPEDARKKKSA